MIIVIRVMEAGELDAVWILTLPPATVEVPYHAGPDHSNAHSQCDPDLVRDVFVPDLRRRGRG